MGALVTSRGNAQDSSIFREKIIECEKKKVLLKV